jgi:predicted RNA-binding Zn ribbon-like protein
VLNALATDWEEQADALQMEAAATYDSAKLQAAQALREIATGLRAVIDEHLQAFDELIDEGLPDAA